MWRVSCFIFCSDVTPHLPFLVGPVTSSSHTHNPPRWHLFAFHSSFMRANSKFWPPFFVFFQVFMEKMQPNAQFNTRRLCKKQDFGPWRRAFCGDNFPVKEARTEPAAARGKSDGGSTCASAYQPEEELCAFTAAVLLPPPEKPFDRVSVPLSLRRLKE